MHGRKRIMSVKNGVKVLNPPLLWLDYIIPTIDRARNISINILLHGHVWVNMRN